MNDDDRHEQISRFICFEFAFFLLSIEIASGDRTGVLWILPENSSFYDVQWPRQLRWYSSVVLYPPDRFLHGTLHQLLLRNTCWPPIGMTTARCFLPASCTWPSGRTDTKWHTNSHTLWGGTKRKIDSPRMEPAARFNSYRQFFIFFPPNNSVDPNTP